MQVDVRKIRTERNLTDAESAVLTYIIEHGGEEARRRGVRGVAAENYTSASTVMRLSRKLGYQGFIDMCYHFRRTEERPADDASPWSFATSLTFTFPASDGEAIDAVAHRLHRGSGFVHIYACGYSSLVAQYLAKKMLGLGIKTLHSSADDSMSLFENNLDRTDTLMVVTRSGWTPRVLKRVQIAADEGICTVAFTCDTDSPVRKLCDFPIVTADDEPLDDMNVLPSMFYARVIVLMEMLIQRYQDLELV